MSSKLSFIPYSISFRKINSSLLIRSSSGLSGFRTSSGHPDAVKKNFSINLLTAKIIRLKALVPLLYGYTV